MNGPARRPQAGAWQTTEQVLHATRRKVYNRHVGGVFARWRIALVLFTQAVFYGLPWLRWQGRQALLFDLVQRRVDCFGLSLTTHDPWLLVLPALIAGYALFLFTAIAGRLFCGYACPQTVYTEVFMWIEQWVEGDRLARIRLDSQPPGLRKFARKTLKHAIWLALALWTGLTFVGYFTPLRALVAALLHGHAGGWQLFWIAFYALATYGNAGFLREQVCKHLCPYARLQPRMFDADTVSVRYDAARGEPRGMRRRDLPARAQGRGDCVDCSICVQVCPTGIDIREGPQYLCIDCAACIDACDQVMISLQSPRGLIRHVSAAGLENRWGWREQAARLLRPRILVHAALLLVLAGVFGAGVARHGVAQPRAPGAPGVASTAPAAAAVAPRAPSGKA